MTLSLDGWCLEAQVRGTSCPDRRRIFVQGGLVWGTSQNKLRLSVPATILNAGITVASSRPQPGASGCLALRGPKAPSCRKPPAAQIWSLCGRALVPVGDVLLGLGDRVERRGDRGKNTACRRRLQAPNSDQHRRASRKLRNRAERKSGDNLMPAGGRSALRAKPIPCYSLFRPLGNSLSTASFFVENQSVMPPVRLCLWTAFEEFPDNFPDSREYSEPRLESRLSETGFGRLRPPPGSPHERRRFPRLQNPATL